MDKQIGEVLYRRLKAVQRDFGLARFELGTLLEVFRSNEDLWKGKSSSFNGFLEEERIQANGAYQFMRVAKKFVLELGLTDAELSEFACVNFRILDMASKIITPQNKDEVLALLVVLGERDARVALSEFLEPEPSTPEKTPVSAPVKSLVRRYRELPDDYRIEFLSQVTPARRLENRGGQSSPNNY